MKKIVFTDLDETLFSSNDIGEPATVDKLNKYHSYSSPKKRALIDLFESKSTLVIPVTGRNSESLNRCILKEILECEYSIVSYGMLVLDRKKKPLQDWINLLHDNYNFCEWESVINYAYEVIRHDLSHIGDKLNVKIIVDHGIVSHLSIKLKRKYYDSDILNEISTYLNSHKFSNFKFHENDRTFALLPPFCNKAKAVQYLKNKISNDGDLVFGIGDSTTDIEFMKQADYMIVPRNTQISRGIDD
ncbi:HAD-IIB family hydrolase [Vibrio alginolyticus]|uniref:HAD-IIB family hydrolase n=1 Tax=Vibrio TaxID=662 RepID=UPI001CDB5EAA|nr:MULTISPECIES: HAD-IIB family hydrolase [Vibrio]MCA2452958.1 HAD-IIB family hydrolase [Vibrio alginolyticus]MDW2232960.1 HAD-IIB family hydrolase [Vibrio sp. 2091]